MNDITPLKVVSLFYYPDENRFRTCDGKTIFNLYPLVSPNMVFLFKQEKTTMTFFNPKYRIEVELLYPIYT